MIPPLEGWPKDDESRPVLIGLTGPIGCGKSTVAAFLREIGGVIVDADDLAREATAPGSAALPEIRKRFGDAVFVGNGALDRAALAEIVFADVDALAALESIVHPRVRVLVDERLEAATRDRVPFAVVEAIKLVEGAGRALRRGLDRRLLARNAALAHDGTRCCPRRRGEAARDAGHGSGRSTQRTARGQDALPSAADGRLDRRNP